MGSAHCWDITSMANKKRPADRYTGDKLRQTIQYKGENKTQQNEE